MPDHSPPFPSSHRATTRTGGVTNRLRRAALVFLSTSVLDATAFGAQASGSPKETRPVTTLTISRLSGGVETRIGKLVFSDDGSVPKLIVEARGPDADALSAAWQEISARDKLPMSVTTTSIVDGQKVTEFGERLVPKGDKMYPRAVWGVLEKKHHYLVDRE